VLRKQSICQVFQWKDLELLVQKVLLETEKQTEDGKAIPAKSLLEAAALPRTISTKAQDDVTRV
jgi:hypothetical protein